VLVFEKYSGRKRRNLALFVEKFNTLNARWVQKEVRE
jgi:hypothetical protein